jgi:hypothetical protein
LSDDPLLFFCDLLCELDFCVLLDLRWRRFVDVVEPWSELLPLALDALLPPLGATPLPLALAPVAAPLPGPEALRASLPFVAVMPAPAPLLPAPAPVPCCAIA